MAKVMAIVDQDGRVLAAQFGDPRAENDGEATPSAQLLPMSGQRVVQLGGRCPVSDSSVTG
jgi:hypothetical protein